MVTDFKLSMMQGYLKFGVSGAVLGMVRRTIECIHYIGRRKTCLSWCPFTFGGIGAKLHQLSHSNPIPFQSSNPPFHSNLHSIPCVVDSLYLIPSSVLGWLFMLSLQLKGGGGGEPVRATSDSKYLQGTNWGMGSLPLGERLSSFRR